ncbi:hypothetical protein EJ110_NYTH36604 [Nymphaea thermarum]|nr:hypothetical protein EJ110_NYTH36604 [Nymphaea thermarum]
MASNSASLGAALRAAHGWICEKRRSFVPISFLYNDKLDETSLSCKLSASAHDKKHIAKYGLMMKKRVEIEDKLVQKFGRW